MRIAVAALLGVAAVGVEDAHAKMRAARFDHLEDPVGPDTQVPVADELHCLAGEPERHLGRIDHDVVVAEAV